MVKLTEKVQNFMECLSVLYFMHHWFLCSQTLFVDVLLLITKPSANKVGIIYSNNSTVILKHLGLQDWEYFVNQGYKPCCIFPIFFFACVFSLHQCCISVCMFWDSLSQGEPVWRLDVKIHSLTAQLIVLYSCDLFPGNTCLQLAAAKGHKQVVQRLVQVTSCSYWYSVHSGFIRFCFKQSGDCACGKWK